MVGMSKPKVKTQPDISLTSPLHQQALTDGDEHFRRWQRNVVDKYKDKSEEEIKIDLQKTSHPCAVLFENWISDFNLSQGIRNCNGFNISKVYYIGNRKIDKRGAVGSMNYTDVQWLSSMSELEALKDQYIFIGVDNVPGSIPMEPYIYPSSPLLCFGEESTGLTPGLQAKCKDIIHISMFGSIRSFNCGTASGITLYDFVSKYRAKQF
jgi:tRNA G18 (ribose-2'-O)-methylase SpoU